MEQTLKFKTNINCGGCVANVKPVLDQAEGICHWDVDTTGKDKVLTVHSTGITEDQIKEKVSSAGYSIEKIH